MPPLWKKQTKLISKVLVNEWKEKDSMNSVRYSVIARCTGRIPRLVSISVWLLLQFFKFKILIVLRPLHFILRLNRVETALLRMLLKNVCKLYLRFQSVTGYKGIRMRKGEAMCSLKGWLLHLKIQMLVVIIIVVIIIIITIHSGKFPVCCLALSYNYKEIKIKIIQVQNIITLPPPHPPTLHFS